MYKFLRSTVWFFKLIKVLDFGEEIGLNYCSEFRGDYTELYREKMSVVISLRYSFISGKNDTLFRESNYGIISS